MIFGDEEWFDKVKEFYPFPIKIAFYIASDGTSNSRGIESKAMTSNIAYRFIRPSKLTDGAEQALISIVYCKSADDYCNEVMRIKEVWRIN